LGGLQRGLGRRAGAVSAIEIVVTGEPVAKGRGRAVRTSGRTQRSRAAPGRRGRAVRTSGGVRVVTPPKTRRWEQDARLMARQRMGDAPPLAGPLRAEVIAVFVPPASWPGWKREAALQGLVAHTCKPDADNIAKAAKDALNGVVWGDDAQVVTLAASKMYGHRAEVRIIVEQMAAAPSQISSKRQLGGHCG
jgi:Holliday junction resolvase RusA-like endonuclease